MRILVTGGAGFLGQYVVRMLASHGHAVHVLDDLSRSTWTDAPAGVDFVQQDIRQPLADLMASVRPEVVIHLAAQISVSDSVADPGHDLAVNGVGTVNVLTAAARAGAQKIVSISSAAVYGRPEHLPLTEESELAALSPYGLSKITSEAYIRLLSSLYGIAYTILRPANLYGPGQTTEGEGAVIPAFLQRFLGGQDPVIQGDGNQTRDFLYVADAAEAIARTLDRADGMVLNISSGEQVAILTLWQQLAGLVGWERPPVFAPPRVGDIEHSVMANARACAVLGWQPHTPLAAGLAATVDWWRAKLG